MDRGKSPGGPRQEATIDGKSPGGPPGSDDRLGIDRGRPGTRRAAGNRRQRAPEGRWHFARRIPAPRKVRGVSPGTDFLLLTARGVSPDTVPALREVRGVSPKRGFRFLTVSGVSPKRWGHIRPPGRGRIAEISSSFAFWVVALTLASSWISPMTGPGRRGGRLVPGHGQRSGNQGLGAAAVHPRCDTA